MKLIDIIDSCKGSSTNVDLEEKISEITIDSREAKAGDLFVALVGERVDGHDFIESAYKNGCRIFLVNKNRDINFMKDDMYLIKVDDTEIALGDISKRYKDNFKIPFIGVTGSVGKTTTRDMIYSVVSTKFRTLRNEKNYNNQIGVPLTLFNLEENHECAIVEMGMCGFNEIEYLANIVNPRIGVISNIGQSHIEKLGSQEGIFKAKMEIATNFDEESTLVVNGDDSFLKSLKNEKQIYKLITFGYDSDNDLYCKKYNLGEAESTFVCDIDGKEEEFYIPTAGKHNIYNALAAICVGRALGMDIDSIREGLKMFAPTGMRQRIESYENITVINDVYNASPDSMKAALEVLGAYKNRRVAILGDIYEMGDFVESGMKEISKSVLRNVDVLITVGENSKYIGVGVKELGDEDIKIYHYKEKELIELDKLISEGDVVLVKASRGMQLEYTVEALKMLNERLKQNV